MAGIIALILGSGTIWWARAQAPLNPVIAAPILTPNLITVNTPTQIVATVPIADPTLNPTSVELYRVNADGSTLLVAQMNDEGRNGDQKPGDRSFTATFVLNQAQVGTLSFHVSAAFRGVNTRLQSTTSIVDVWQGHPPVGLIPSISFPSTWRASSARPGSDPAGTAGLYFFPVDEEYPGDGITVGVQQNTTLANVVAAIASTSNITSQQTIQISGHQWQVVLYEDNVSGILFISALAQRSNNVLTLSTKFSSLNQTILSGMISLIQ